jgi:hypothetical protein
MEALYHYVKYAAIYLIFGLTMGISSIEKLTEPVPDWFSEQFVGTFVETFPGLSASWLAAGVLEVLVAVLIVVSRVRLAFMAGKLRPWLRTGMALAAFTFMLLAIGQRVSSQFDGAASLFFYFGATMATLLVVHRDEAAEAVTGVQESRASVG